MARAQLPGTSRVSDVRTVAMVRSLLEACPFTWVTQGSYNAGGVAQSAGTHDGGGVVDLHASSLSAAERLDVLTEARRRGFAAWLRTPYQGDWVWHIHAVAIGCSDLSSSAARQVTAYLNDRNGLSGNGPDDGPDGFRRMTWEKYNEMLAAAQPGRDITISLESIQRAARGDLVTHTRAHDVDQLLAYAGPAGIDVVPQYTIDKYKAVRADASENYGAAYLRYVIKMIQLRARITPDGEFGPVTGTYVRRTGGYNIVS